MHERTDKLRTQLRKAIIDLPDCLQEPLLIAAEPAFKQMEADEFKQWIEQEKEERYFKFIDNTELSTQEREGLRLLRYYFSSDNVMILLKLIDIAIERIDDLEMNLEAVTDY